MDFVVPANDRVSIKENGKRDKYLDLAWELKKLLFMKVTMIPIVISVLWTIPYGLVRWLEVLEIRRQTKLSKLQSG